jgi:hypothetical protein
VARIIPDDANVVLDQQSIGNSGQFHDPPPGFEEFLSMRGLSSKGFFGFNKTMSFYEDCSRRAMPSMLAARRAASKADPTAKVLPQHH